MSLLDLNMVSMLVDDLNTEIRYQVSGGENVPMTVVKNFLSLHTDGGNHTIYFLGSKIWSTDEERVSVELEIELNTKENFESFLRSLVQSEVNAVCHIDLLNVKS